MAKQLAQRPTLPRIVHLKTQAPTDFSAFAVPDYERVLGQENPFPADHRLHREWESRQRAAATEAAQLHARLLDRDVRSWGDLLERDLEWWSGVFDIRAAALMLPGMSPSAYAEHLGDHAEAILSMLQQRELPIGEELVAKLRARLQQRAAHWMVQAHTTDQQLRARASTPASAQGAPQPAPVAPTSPTKWEEVKLHFLGEHDLQVFVNGQPQAASNYAVMGFEDRRTKAPSKAWETLLDLARADGILKVDRAPVRYEKQGKRVQEIRRALQQKFELTDNPLPLVRDENSYHARFKVTRTAAFDADR